MGFFYSEPSVEIDKGKSPNTSPRSDEQSAPLTARQRRRSRTPSPKSGEAFTYKVV